MEVGQELQTLVPDAVSTLKEFFVKPASGDARDDIKRASQAISLLRTVNGAESNRLKGIALARQLTRDIGMKGEELRPLFNALRLPAAQFSQIAASSEQKPDIPGNEKVKAGQAIDKTAKS